MDGIGDKESNKKVGRKAGVDRFEVDDERPEGAMGPDGAVFDEGEVVVNIRNYKPERGAHKKS